MHIVHLQNIEKNGRIVICNGGKEIFFLCLLHYNDTCKVNQQFTGGERKVIKLNILNMKNFLDTVNACIGKVYICSARTVKNKTLMGKKRYRTVCGDNTSKTKTVCVLF